MQYMHTPMKYKYTKQSRGKCQRYSIGCMHSYIHTLINAHTHTLIPSYSQTLCQFIHSGTHLNAQYLPLVQKALDEALQWLLI
jgi:hypothetical protein